MSRLPGRRRPAHWGRALLALAAVGSAPAAAELPSPWELMPARAIREPGIDAAPLCVPPDLAPPLRSAFETAQAGGSGALDAALAQLSERRQSSGDAGGLAGDAGELAEAMLRARAATDPSAEREAAGRLDAALQAVPASGLRACAHLERARLALRDRQLPEALVELRRAERAHGAGPLPDALRSQASFGRAEALWRSGARAEAAALYAGLAHDAEPRLAAAAALRLAQARAEAEPGGAARAAFERALVAAASFGADPAEWGAKAAELAFAAKDFAAARRWLALVPDAGLEPVTAGLLAIRRADAELALGRGDEARDLLRAVSARHAKDAAGALALVRMLDLGIADLGEEEALRRLRRVIDHPEPGIAVYARAILARHLVAAQQLDVALDVLTRVAYDDPPAALVPGFVADLGEALALASAEAAHAAPGDCAVLVRRLGGRRNLLRRHTRAPEPFLRLGDCYLSLGLPGPALDTYRSVGKSGAAQHAAGLALRVAQATFARGELGAARAQAENQIHRAALGNAVDDLDAWTLLLAEIELVAGDPAAVVPLLEPALRAGSVRAALVPRAALVLARAALRAGAGPELRATLEQALGQRAEDEGEEAAGLRHEALLRVADLQRNAGADAAAGRLYAAAAEALPPGAQQARASYWAGALASDGEAARSAWQRAAAAPDGAAWSRLARSELALRGLREAVGGAEAPAPAAATAEQPAP